MEKAKRTEPVRINKIAIVFITVCAHVIGLIPAALLMERPVILAYVFGGVIFISILSIWKFTSRATEKPGTLEFLLGGLNGILVPAYVGILWMACYGILFGIMKLVEFIIHAGGGDTIIPAGAIAFVPTVILGGLFVAALSGFSASELGKKLYPDIAGVRSEYFRFFTTDRSKLVGTVMGLCILILIPTLLLLFTSWNRIILYIIMQIIFFLLGSLFGVVDKMEKSEKKKWEGIVERIDRLLQIAGYQTVVNPRTQDASIDPLLTSLDIYASRDAHKLLLDIKSSTDADMQVDWKAASTLIQAAFLFSRENDIQPSDMDARLLLVDVEPDKSLKTMSRQETISILAITEQQVDGVLNMQTREEQVNAIRELLRLNQPGPSLAEAAKV